MIQIDKRWGAINEDEEVVIEAETRESLFAALGDEGLLVDDFDIVALPKSHSTIFV